MSDRLPPSPWPPQQPPTHFTSSVPPRTAPGGGGWPAAGQPQPSTGAPAFAPNAPQPGWPGPHPGTAPAGYGYSPQPGPGMGPGPAPAKSFVVTWLLSMLLGVFGADRFYLGKTATAIVKLLTLGGIGIWWLVDLIITVFGKQTDKFGRPLEGYDRTRTVALIVTPIVVIAMIVFANTRPGSSTRADDLEVERPAPAAAAPAATRDAPAPEPTPVETVVPEPVVETVAPEEPAAAPSNPYGAAYPAAQQQFLDRIQQAIDAYDSASTDLQRSQVLTTRDADLCGITGGTMQNWVGKILRIGATGDGNAYVDIEIADNVVVSTWNNEFSDLWDETLIPANSPLFNQLVAMPEGALVKFNGTFEPGDGVCLKTDNLTEVFGVLDPNFVSNFTAIVQK